MLKQLFRPTPKWQSPKSQRRIEAIAEFQPEQTKDLDILVRMAREDSEPAVRREAVRKLHDLDLLQQIQRKDLDATVREAAASCFNELLAGKSPLSPPITQRIERIRQISSMQTLGYLIKEAQPIEIKIAAVEQISDEILLEGIALKSGISRLRQLAAERISNPRMLESLASQSRNGDKSVYRIAREKLDALHSLEKAHSNIQDRIQALCEAMEQQARAALNPLFRAKTESLMQQWQEISADAEPAQAERFDTARDIALQIVDEQQRAAQQKQEQEQAAIEQLASCEALEQALAELAANPDSFDLPALAALVKTQGLRWEVALETLPVAAMLEQRYQQAMQRLQEAQSLMEAVQNQRELLESTIQSAQDATPAETSAALAPLNTLVESLPATQGLPLPSILRMAYSLLEKQASEEIGKGADETADKTAENAGLRKQLKTLLDALDEAIQAGNSKLASKKLREAQQLTKQHHLHDNRLTGLMHRVQELKDWAGFAVLPKKEALVAEMTALADRAMDPDEKADAIKALQDSWKTLGVTDPHVENPLWEKFKAASDHAYEPCRAHFAEQRELRHQHAQKREEICQELEAYFAALPSPVSVRHLDTLIRAARQEWQRYFPVERQQAHTLQQRFNKILKQLEALLKKELSVHEAQKRALIAEAGALLDEVDSHEACKRIKAIQLQWKQVEPARHKTEQLMWKEFRNVCDQIFAKRDAEIQSRKAASEAGLAEAEALIAAQQQLADAALKGEADHGQSAQLADAFRALALTREQRQPMQKRFDAAHRHYEQNLRQARQQQQQAGIQRFIEAFRLCADAEATAMQQGMADNKALLPFLADGALKEPWLSLLKRRVQELPSATADTAQAADWQARVSTNASIAGNTCLELEILLDQPSPPALREARLQMQMEMLQKNAFQRGGNQEQKARDKLSALLALAAPDPRGEYGVMARLETLVTSGKLTL
jgi:hypothetical protein